MDVMETQGLDLPREVAATIVSAQAFEDPDRIDATFTWIRNNNPLGVARVAGYMPFWVVSKHADVLEVARRNDLYDSTSLPFILGESAAFDRMREINDGDPFPFKSLTGLDDPEHAVQRKLFTPLFLAPAMKAREARVREIAREEIDRMAAMGGRCDFANDVALGYPLRVVMDFLGVPPEDEAIMTQISNQLFNGDDEEINEEGAGLTEAELAEQMRAAFKPMEEYFGRITAERRIAPREDVATLIANARIDGAAIDERRALGHYLSFATAGHHTTASSLAGAIQILCENSAHLAALKADPAIVPTFVEETLRWISPAKHFMRCAAVDTELRGRAIRKGDWMYLSYASANRDEEAFDEPFAFRSDRKPIRHVAFGFGVHQCLGNMLARMELRVFLEELVQRVDSMRLDGEPVLTRSRWVQGLKTCPIEFTML